MTPEQAAREARWLSRLRSAYRKCFEGPDGKLDAAATLVLGDLYNVCHQGRSVTSEMGWTPEQVLVAEGERRAYLRIVNMLRVSDADLYEAALAMAREQRDVLDTGEMT